MHRIDTAGNVGGLFANPDPIHGQIPVVVDAAWLNDIQESLVAPLTAAGIAPVKGTYTQLLAAIEILATHISGPVLSQRSLHFQTSGVDRWQIWASSDAESGGNAGSILQFARYNDAGAFIDIPFQVLRNSGLVVAGSGLTVSSGPISFPAASVAGSSITAATTAAPGSVALATNAQALALTDATHAITAANLGALDASTTQQGLIATATNAQAIAATLATLALVPANLAALFTSSFSTASWSKNAVTGEITQFGFLSMGDDTLSTITLPTTFPNACRSLVGGVQSASAIVGGNGGGFIGNILSTSQIQVGQAWSSSSAGTGVWWEAKGN